MLKTIQRMKELALHLESFPEVLCLLGLGSMSETSRADEYSDIDFFLIIEDGKREELLADLSWLSVKPIVYSFRNSDHGHKVLFEDGVYGEYALFTKEEIVKANFTKGVIYYKKDDFDTTLVEPKNSPKRREVNIEYNVNEALTNIYVGLLRLKRGEISNASTFVQVYSYNLILPLFEKIYKQEDEFIDPYVFERRIEFRYKEANEFLQTFRQGYNKTKESAKAMLDFLEDNYLVNKYMINKINKLLI